LDIRSLKEYDEGHLEGSKLVEYNGGDMDNTFNYMPKDNKYLVYSLAGDRSKNAMESKFTHANYIIYVFLHKASWNQ